MDRRIRKIPRPVGENAGLRDDANRLGNLADKTAPFPVEWRFDSSHALTHSNPVECPPQLARSSQRPLIRAPENCAIVFFVPFSTSKLKAKSSWLTHTT